MTRCMAHIQTGNSYRSSTERFILNGIWLVKNLSLIVSGNPLLIPTLWHNGNFQLRNKSNQEFLWFYLISHCDWFSEVVKTKPSIDMVDRVFPRRYLFWLLALSVAVFSLVLIVCCDFWLNLYTPVCHTTLMISIQRFWYWINLQPPNLYFYSFSSLVCLIFFWYCKEKFCLGHSWELKDCLPRHDSLLWMLNEQNPPHVLASWYFKTLQHMIKFQVD